MVEEEKFTASKHGVSEQQEEDEEVEEEEEEALSLSDLPLNEEEKINCCKAEETQLTENEEEFNFGSKESEMCTADEVFFKGQILPLRLSVSSESGLILTKFQQQETRHRCLSRSESMDHLSSSSTASTSINSSRSSSTRSYYSSSTTTVSSLNSKQPPQQKIRNNFHSFPSPNPQIRVSSFRLSNVGNTTRTQKSTIWDLFRVGLVRAPEIELQDLKNRNNKNGSVSRNSSSGSSSNNSSNCNPKQSNVLEKKIGGLLNFSGCKCSIDAIETVPLNKQNDIVSEELRIKQQQQQQKKIKKKQRMEKKNKEEGKREISRHRTFEWLKELSNGSYVLVDDHNRQ